MNTDPSSKRSRGWQAVGLMGWLVFCFAAAGSASFVSTDGWFVELRKPSWNPPSWLFGPVWTLLYAMMSVAAWLVWKRGGWKVQGRALGVFCVQWLFNALWTPLFFGAHLPGWAFLDIVLLWLSLAATVVLFWRVDRLAGALLIPYLAWVTFAAALNLTIWRMNV
ncbi:MAG: tryptophan-rich sensory protein [Tepidisphaera sp.]